ncbi:hypothetical protein [Deinococcus ficus]|uniref:Uncharacterized protein n=1 Tax=Deinococcus ficus TaxID=317577 RepID=A0A221T2Y8_9DEIO|nr:hypothetical protein [Deinococcus ficus]ASN83262.1 hypothetical protein DFI_18870 [Deinococcus ficus]
MHVDTTDVRTFVTAATAQLERTAAANCTPRERRSLNTTRPLYHQVQDWLERHPDPEITLPSGWCTTCDSLAFLAVLNSLYGFGDGITSQWAAWYVHHQLMARDPANPDRWSKAWRRRLTGKLGKRISAPGHGPDVLPLVHEALTGHPLP